MILDTHTHVWGPPSTDRPWIYPESVAFIDNMPLDTVYDVESLRRDMDNCGITEAVIVGFPLTDWTDNSYLISAVQRNENLSGIALVDIFADDAAEQVRELMAVDGILGIRLGVAMPYEQMWRMGNSGPSAAWLPSSLEETEFWNAVLETDAQVQLWVSHEQLDQVHALLEAYPDLPVVVDHLARLTPDIDRDHPSRRRLADLAEYPSVGVKLSHVPVLSTQKFPYSDMFDHVSGLLDSFGRERLFWGSDYQYLSGEHSYVETLHWLDHMDSVSTADTRWLRYRSFDRFSGSTEG